MSESEFYTDNPRYKAQGGALAWPDWELQAHGSAAPELGPWFSARLSFPHGARIDVLVTVNGDRLTVEDVRADPPLTLDDLASLAHWIEGPLDDACRAATGRPPKSPAGAAAAPDPAPGPAPAAPEQREGTARPRRTRAGTNAPAGDVVHGEGALCGPATAPAAAATPAAPAPDDATLAPAPGATPDDAPGPAPTDATEAAPGTARTTATAEGDAPEPETGPHPAPGATPDDGAGSDAAGPPAEPRSAVLVRSRAGERRKIAAAAYRAAQQDGRDPIQAVMHATGRNRRRALRLIAGARDAGLLTPRHNKR
ncbi:DUF6214 family protein [Streptomyces sp. MspMP-M5]|uniref:DUF6214 family protein n=1 Tax=Streptomyces sp. MspMP-M5 TaxID=1155718 RepID=UPI00036E5CDE|nr:hypothetical protein [Streptomyces sp. SID8354]